MLRRFIGEDIDLVGQPAAHLCRREHEGVDGSNTISYTFGTKWR